MPETDPWLVNESSEVVMLHLREGRCVLLPSESTYELVGSALHPQACATLREFAAIDQTPAMVFGAYPNLFDWLPLLEGAGARLFRKVGAGPITLQADAGHACGLWRFLPEDARRLVVREGNLAIRWPAHPLWDKLRQHDLPLVSIPLRGAVSVEEAAPLIGASAACVIDDGATHFGALPTLVVADGRRCRLLREGAVTREQIDDLALCRILFICTGNTCRSPMAEVLCAKLLADVLGCAANDLKELGFYVQSAGLAAMMGGEAAVEAVRTVAQRGVDLSLHRSRMATMEMLQWADHIFCMTASHADALMPIPHLVEPRLLSAAGDDVADPIGGTEEDYRVCAEQIVQYLKERLPELLES